MRAKKSIPLSSVCIPAFNEEKNISQVLDFLTRQPHSLLDEIVICVNGCTDNTAEIVTGFSDKDRRIKLIESEIGKPNAWNALVKEAKNDSLVFLDADIQIKDEKCLENLLKTLHGKDYLIAVGGIPLPLPHQSRFTSVVEVLYDPLYCDYLAGNIYAVKKYRIMERMRSLNYERMPSNLIREDFWLETLFRKSEFYVEKKSVVYITTGNLESYLRYAARLDVGFLQIKEEYPEQFKRWLDEFRSSDIGIKSFANRLKNVEGIYHQTRVMVRAIFVELVKFFYHSRIKRYYHEIYAQYREKGGGFVLANTGRGRVFQSKL